LACACRMTAMKIAAPVTFSPQSYTSVFRNKPICYKDIAATHSLPLLHSALARGLTYNLRDKEYVDYIPVNGYCVILIVTQLAQNFAFEKYLHV
jgi:hypothetical protein